MLNARDFDNYFDDSEDISSHSSPNSQRSTKPDLASEALHGVVGEIVNAIDPYTEADKVSVLTNMLAGFGNVIGPIHFFKVEHSHHYLNIFVAQVGETSKGRKGTGWSTPRRMLKAVDSDWSDRIAGGLSSGEGLVYAVRDERTEKAPIKERGRVIDYQEVIVDHGAGDKRLLLVEEELSQALKVMSREGNILSAILRQAWDGITLNPLTKKDPIKATGAHISIIGHITRAELLRYLTATEQANGFANRFCWFLVERSKIIPEPEGIPDDALFPLIEKLEDAVSFARRITEIRRDSRAKELWRRVYPQLSEGKPGLAGAVISRAEAQVMRFASLYALMDRSELVRAEDLIAALALWDYSEKSARVIFGNIIGDPSVDKAKAALKEKGELTLTELHGLFGRHASKSEVDRVAKELVRQGIALLDEFSNGVGKPTIILRLAAKQAN